MYCEQNVRHQISCTHSEATRTPTPPRGALKSKFEFVAIKIVFNTIREVSFGLFNE